MLTSCAASFAQLQPLDFFSVSQLIKLVYTANMPDAILEKRPLVLGGFKDRKLIKNISGQERVCVCVGILPPLFLNEESPPS